MQKTKKSVSKRVKLTRKGKMLRHNMSKVTGTKQGTKTQRHKRNRGKVSAPDARVMKKYLPHHPNQKK